MDRRPLLKRIAALDPELQISGTVWSISNPFGLLFPATRQVTNVLLTLPPLTCYC